MSRSFNIETTGIDELIQKLKTVTDNINDSIDAALYESADILLNKMLDEVPVDTGRTLDALDKSNPTASPSGGRQVKVGDVNKKVPYIWYAEAQNPFMARSKRLTRARVVKSIKTKLVEEIEKEW